MRNPKETMIDVDNYGPEVASKFDGSEPDFRCQPPNTALSHPIYSVDRGCNFYGSLAEDFYLVTDNSFDPKHVVLWMGDNGSQNDDDQPRLLPVAWCEYKKFWDEEEGRFLEWKAAAVLLYAWFRYAIDAWGHYVDEAEQIRQLGQETDLFDEVLIAAADHKPFRWED